MEPYIELEKKFGEWIGNPNTVACSSGTSALHLAIEALELPRNSGVFVPEFTMIACARAVTLAGLKPVFVDCGKDLLINPQLIPAEKSHVTEHVSAVMPVHIYGRRCNMPGILTLANRHKFAIIEDLAEAHGIPPHPASDAACWSFYRNKIIAGEEGGMIAFRDPEHAKRARQLRSLGFTESHDFLHIPRGINARLSNVHASLILESLANVNENIQKRYQIEKWYDERIPDQWKMPEREVCWVYDIRISRGDTIFLVRELNRQGVAARLGFRPMSQQPEYLGYYQQLLACDLAKHIIYLPIDPLMTEEDVADICEILMATIPTPEGEEACSLQSSTPTE